MLLSTKNIKLHLSEEIQNYALLEEKRIRCNKVLHNSQFFSFRLRRGSSSSFRERQRKKVLPHAGISVPNIERSNVALTKIHFQNCFRSSQISLAPMISGQIGSHSLFYWSLDRENGKFMYVYMYVHNCFCLGDSS